MKVGREKQLKTSVFSVNKSILRKEKKKQEMLLLNHSENILIIYVFINMNCGSLLQNFDLKLFPSSELKYPYSNVYRHIKMFGDIFMRLDCPKISVSLSKHSLVSYVLTV